MLWPWQVAQDMLFCPFRLIGTTLSLLFAVTGIRKRPKRGPPPRYINIAKGHVAQRPSGGSRPGAACEDKWITKGTAEGRCCGRGKLPRICYSAHSEEGSDNAALHGRQVRNRLRTRVPHCEGFHHPFPLRRAECARRSLCKLEPHELRLRAGGTVACIRHRLGGTVANAARGTGSRESREESNPFSTIFCAAWKIVLRRREK